MAEPIPRPFIQSQDGRKMYLDESPSVEETDEWLLELGCQKKKVGKTVQGRDIHLYSMEYYPLLPFPKLAVGQDVDSKNILFLSLVHGNEPMGLVTLLMGAKYLAEFSSRQTTGREQLPSARIYFLPIVNVDAYEINSQQGQKHRGCQRTNLRPTCGMPNTTTGSLSRNDTIVVEPCGGRWLLPDATTVWRGGVDLNRNFPTDWAESDFECISTYSGPHPLSEPETQAIATVVDTFNITHAMSLHSMSHSKQDPLMIHPFTSSRSFETMDKRDARLFREWSTAMNRQVDYFYITGTAQEAIKYTAGGTTIDWMYAEKKITSFVLEVVPPCETRWCRGRNVYDNALPHAATMKNFVHLSLAVDHNWDLGDYYEDWGFEDYKIDPVFIIPFFYLGIVYLTVKGRHRFRLFLYRFFLRVKERPTEDERVEAAVELSPGII